MSITLCAIMKNEAPYIDEWAVFHKLIGFDRIVAYENDSVDGTCRKLEGLWEAGIIDEMLPWRNIGGSPQLRAYEDAIRKCDTDWLMFLDVDEFLNLHIKRNVNRFIETYKPSVSSIAVNWRIFGSDGQKVASEGLVLERFTAASTKAAAANRHVKTLFRPSKVRSPHIHAPEMSEGLSVLSDGTPLEMRERGISSRVEFTVAQVNHYFTKSYEEYLEKRKRGNANRNLGDADKFTRYTEEMFHVHDLNDDVDRTISWAIPDFRVKCSELREKRRESNV